MSDEQFALSPAPSAPPPTEADYEAILAAVMETVRGRWFLSEFSHRNRQTDTRLVLAAIERLESTLRSEREGPAIERIRFDIREMARAINLTKREIAAIKPDHEHAGRIDQATEELDSIVQTTEQATSDILAAAEQIQETAWTLREQGVDGTSCDHIDGRSTDIYLACSFQDLTGQRIRKVIQVLRFLEGRINAMVEILGADEPGIPPAEGALDGSFKGEASHFDTALDQAEIDQVIPATQARRMGGDDHAAASQLIIDHEPVATDAPEAVSIEPVGRITAGAGTGPEAMSAPEALEHVTRTDGADALAALPADGAIAHEEAPAEDMSVQEGPTETSNAPASPEPVSAAPVEVVPVVPDLTAPAEPSAFEAGTIAASPPAAPAPDLASPAEPISVNEAVADDVPALPPDETGEPASETAPAEPPSVSNGFDAAGAKWPLHDANAPRSALDYPTAEPHVASPTMAVPEPAVEAAPTVIASETAENDAAPALMHDQPSGDAADQNRIDDEPPHRPVVVDTEALLAELLAIVRPSAQSQTEPAEASADEAEPPAPAATADDVNHPTEEHLPAADAEMIADASLAAVAGALSEADAVRQEAAATQAFAALPVSEIEPLSEPDTLPVDPVATVAISSASGDPSVETFDAADRDTLSVSDSSPATAFANGDVPFEHPDIVEPGILSADFVIVPTDELPAEAEGLDLDAAAEAESDDAEAAEIGLGSATDEPDDLQRHAPDDAGTFGVADGDGPPPAPASVAPSQDDGPATPEPELAMVDAVAAEADEDANDDIFLPLPETAAPARTASASAERRPAANEATLAPAPPVAAAAIYPRSNGVSSATIIEVPLAQAASSIETATVSLTGPAVGAASPPLVSDVMPARPATDLSLSAFAAAPMTAGALRPLARPVAPLAPNDPLAAVAALSVEEKIALFS